MVVSLLKITIVLSLIAATAQTVSLFSDPHSNLVQRLLFVSKVLTCLVANLDVFIIIFYYSHLTAFVKKKRVFEHREWSRELYLAVGSML
ncbi:hypothetical protein TSMEX_003555 [Taenia solium]|eukprot:TsM_000571200 transcript=TsM_000571200 gene=TsM_000571200